MNTPLLACIGLSATLLAAACAPTTGTETAEAPRSARQCFAIQQVTNFRQGRMDQVFLRVGRSDVYELNSAGGCRDLDFAMRLAILPDIGGVSGSRLCTGDGARIVVPDAALGPESCRTRITRKLTDEEVAALPDAHRP
jgi:hypothetical protein